MTGTVIIKGLGNGLFAFNETVVPEGYNRLEVLVYLVVEGREVRVRQQERRYPVFGLNDANFMKIANASGLAIPGTGGIGTTIFYVAGAALVLGAGILLILKKHRDGDRE